MTSPANTTGPSRISRIRRRLREVKLPYAVYLALQRLNKPGLFEYDHQYVLSLDLTLVTAQATEKEDIREITAEDREDLDTLEEPSEIVLERLAKGQRLWVLQRDGRIIAFDWIAGSEKTISDWLIFEGAPGDFWGHFLKVSSECRGMGLGPKLRLHVCRAYARAGYSRLLTTVAAGNRNSISYQLRAGARPVGRFRFLSLLGITLLNHGGRWRAGFWRRDRPLRLQLEDTAVSGFDISHRR